MFSVFNHVVQYTRDRIVVALHYDIIQGRVYTPHARCILKRDRSLALQAMSLATQKTDVVCCTSRYYRQCNFYIKT